MPESGHKFPDFPQPVAGHLHPFCLGWRPIPEAEENPGSGWSNVSYNSELS
jgi:hypothetical protein